jgi:hypothetical protein
MKRKIKLPKGNEFIISENNLLTITGSEAHTVYFEARQALYELQKSLKENACILLTKENENKFLIELIETILKRELNSNPEIEIIED